MILDNLPERIRTKIAVDSNGCWIWQAAMMKNGYGLIQCHPKLKKAHRVVYEILIGPIPKPTLNHLCRVRACVNPSHLVPATHRENIMASGSQALAKANAERDICLNHGLPLIRVSARQRRCRKCLSEWNHRAYVARARRFTGVRNLES